MMSMMSRPSSCTPSLVLLMMMMFTLLVFVTLPLTAAQFEGFGGGQGTPCAPYRCPGGKDFEPVPKWPLHLESPGCSGMGGIQAWNVGDQNKADSKTDPQERCCDLRHACLQTCGAKKAFCDEQFKTCSKAACDTIDDEESKKKCESGASINQLMVQLDTCAAYNTGQASHCECVAKGADAAAARERVLRAFYKKYNPTNVDKVAGLAAKADTPAKMVGLLVKLYDKYYNHEAGLIKKVKNPQQDYMDQILKETKEKTSGDNDGPKQNEAAEDMESDAEDLGTEEL